MEDHASPWQRIFRGRADVKHAYGGWFFTSAFSRNSAPPGKHLLTFWLETFSESGKPGWRSWADARADLDVAIDYLHQYYADLDECVEWSRYQYKTPPSWLSWYLKPAYRHPVKVSTIDGFYVASATAETKGSFLDIECAVGLEAAELAQQERGHLVSDARPLTAAPPRARRIPMANPSEQEIRDFVAEHCRIWMTRDKEAFIKLWKSFATKEVIFEDPVGTPRWDGTNGRTCGTGSIRTWTNTARSASTSAAPKRRSPFTTR
ncbi:hypothetical protein MBRA_49980 (plasmid) [Mycobacterium branderi]|uniref:Uncharacterized protein n=1 Tax=Mycobacterium branderi TaxID=43348 RepID=A0ABN6BFJ9_9MYCO|nr:hypothetical protein MBRA_49980 [Mycobacterium branderi]